MNYLKRAERWLLLTLVALIVASCASQQPPPHSANFVEPRSMEPMINFWEKVYSQWDEETVVFHDDRYMDVIYLEAHLSTDQQKERQALRDYLLIELDDLERKLVTGEKLTVEQKRYAEQLRKSGGAAALVGISDRLRSQRGLKNRFKRGLESSYTYLHYFRGSFKERGLPEEIAYLPHVESSFVNHAVSKVGASGMWQFMRSTANSFLPMENGAFDGRLDPYLASRGAALYLEEAYRLTGSWPLAITAYNHGAGGMMRAKRIYGDDIGTIVWRYDGPRFGFASRNFYAEFLAARRIANQPNRYFKNLKFGVRPNIEGIELRAPLTLTELSEKSGISRYELIKLNPAWLNRIHNDSAMIPANVPTWLPKGSTKRIKDKHFFRIPHHQP